MSAGTVAFVLGDLLTRASSTSQVGGDTIKALAMSNLVCIGVEFLIGIQVLGLPLLADTALIPDGVSKVAELEG